MTSSAEVNRAWLSDQRRSLLNLAARSRHPAGGFAWLDDHGAPLLDRDVELWICARMTHVSGLGLIEGVPGSESMLDHGVKALQGPLRDHEYGGWFAQIDRSGPTVAEKRAYEHAFVILAATTAVAAGHPDGERLLTDALTEFDRRFWDEETGLALDVYSRDWQELEEYRGVNANMHTVEALLAAYDVTGESLWRDRAARIVHRVVHEFARGNGYRLPEHFTPSWEPVLEYNRDDPAHPFRPYGVTIGHLFEWSRLALHLRTALGETAPEWLLTDAVSLFDVGVTDGWAADSTVGFVYTTDFDGRPVVRARLHWVLTEAIAAAWTLHLQTGESRYLALYRAWWDHAVTYYIDPANSSWQHELDPDNVPASTVWVGRPDVYHAYQAALLPALGETVSFGGAARRIWAPGR